ncbi:MAG: hypothetical protein DRQ88_08180 [Epsilonproteobacteria bacterium]|nr:MAG: hypothetical protein DRQ89_09200 [Campylobacterota bacterium]RLA66026.1 MAG: hypothetical protein DRQ88_08180 [Campylobacterota bacterium]
MKFGQILLNFLWALLYIPLGLPISLLIPWARRRANFERQNFKDPLFKAQIAFEVSSEGELEQVFPLLEYFLKQGEKLELIYSSESVESKAQSLAQNYPKNLRIFRLPLITHFFVNSLGGQSLKSLISAPVLILCRYDFYPQLLSLPKKLGLVSASAKGKKKACIYKLFDFIVCASPEEKLSFKKFYKGELFELDFRIQRIGDRLEKSQEILAPFFKELPIQRRIIMGSCWPNEMELFSHPKLQADILAKEIQMVLAPHSLKKESIAEIISSFKVETNGKIPIYHLDESVDALKLMAEMNRSPGVLLVTFKGILCELYTLFGTSFVGGGHGRSIHSVLEPYLAGNRVYCGPKTYRSTEFDFIMSHSPNYIHVVRSLGEFYDIYNNKPIGSDEMKKREQILTSSRKKFDQIISLIVGKVNE